MSEFTWVREPWQHQREAFERAKAHTDFGLFFEMGTGKTFTTINILRWRYLAVGRVMRTFIFCPPIVRENWRRELRMASRLGPQVEVLDGTEKQRVATLAATKRTIFITNYESLTMKTLFEALTEFKPEVLVFDECHRLKNAQAKRTKAAIELADLASHRYILSGTPILNSLLDIWSQFRVLDCGQSFDPNFYSFRARYFQDINAGMPKQSYFPAWRPRRAVESELHAKIYEKCMRVFKSQCLDLPPLVRKRIEVALAPGQQKAYDEMKQHFITYLNDKACVATLALTKLLRMQQIIAGFVPLEGEETATWFADTPRLAALLELVEDLAPHHKVIIWCSFREAVAQVKDALGRLDLEYRLLVGGMTGKAQQDAVDQFQTDRKVRILIANQQAGGTGINLTAASYMIYYSRTHSLEADLQSEARNYRGGSEAHQKITRIDLVCPETVDEDILHCLEAKQELAESVLKMKKLASLSA